MALELPRGVGGTARSRFGSPTSCSRSPPLPGASPLRCDGGARPAVADAGGYPQESEVTAARRRTSKDRLKTAFATSSIAGRTDMAFLLPGSACPSWGERSEGWPSSPRCAWPACRSRGDRPSGLRDLLREAASCLLIECRELPYASDGLLAALGTSPSDSGRNPTRRRRRPATLRDRCAILPKHCAVRLGAVVAPSKEQRIRAMRLEANVKDSIADTGITMTLRTVLAAAPFVAAAAGPIHKLPKAALGMAK